jgi:hypothetical protein
MTLGATLLWQGKLEPALAHFQRGFEMFDPNMQFPDWPGSHPGVQCQFYLALISWILGCPDRSLDELRAALASAETLEHPLTLAQTLCYVALVHIFRHEPSAAADYAERALRICEEHRIAQWRVFALCANGWALGISGESEKGLTQIAQGVDGYDLGPVQHMLLALQADAQLAIGKPEAALASVAAGWRGSRRREERRLKQSSGGSGARHCSPARDAERGRDGHRGGHRGRAPAEREILGIARRDEPRPPAPPAGPAARGSRPPRPDSRLVRRRPRHRRPQRGQDAARQTA